MHLLNTRSQRLEHFVDANIPIYAILSHTWDKTEITFQDIQAPVAAAAGYEKIRNTCNFAYRRGFDYVWIDTCCIDKKSSAELSEAINSMYRWYRQAAICYAYLSDVTEGRKDLYPGRTVSTFHRSRWFERGFTLQELIAPRVVVFLNQNWEEISTKAKLVDMVSSITSIPKSALLGDDLYSFSVAQKMSWASRRETSRIEDQAYCLMGIFGVNMPLLYGEGRRAFRRLQEAILKISDDYTIFAWKSSDLETYGPLAVAPSVFHQSQNIVPVRFAIAGEEPIVLDSKGVHLYTRLLERHENAAEVFAILPCQLEGRPETLALHLRRISGSDRFIRVNCEKLESIDADWYDAAILSRVCIALGYEAQEKWQALSKLAAHGHEGMIRDLLEGGANPEEGIYNDFSPLMNATISGHEKVVRLLLEYGADRNRPSLGGQRPLEIAIGMNNESLVQSLLEENAFSKLKNNGTRPT